MLITIDGLIGAGKTTLKDRLTERYASEILEVNHIHSLIHWMVGTISGPKRYDYILAHVLAQPKLEEAKHYLWESYWELIYDSPPYAGSVADEVDKCLAFFRHALEVTEQPAPDISIFLLPRLELACTRRIKRELDIDVNERDVPPKMLTQCQHLNAFLRTLASKLRNSHIIVDSESDKIFNVVCRIIEAAE